MGSGGGGGYGTYEQLCEQDARDSCAAIGYAGNEVCFLVFAQNCSESDEADAIAYCTQHPEIPHDESCHPYWR